VEEADRILGDEAVQAGSLTVKFGYPGDR